MRLVVADTGPINYLIQIACVDALHGLAEAVVVSSSVLEELRSIGAPEVVRAWAACPPAWIQVREPDFLMPEQPDLSMADRSAISLAKELKAVLLMDDRKARLAAAEQKVSTIGTLGVLEAAAAMRLISLPVALSRLQATNMFVTEDLISKALQRDALRQAGM